VVYSQEDSLLISEDLVCFQPREGFCHSCIIFIERDFQQTACEVRAVCLTIQVIAQDLNSQTTPNSDLQDQLEHMNHDKDDLKLYLMKNILLKMPSSDIMYYIDVVFDRKFDDDETEYVRLNDCYYIQRVINLRQASVQPIKKVHPINEELKVAYFG